MLIHINFPNALITEFSYICYFLCNGKGHLPLAVNNNIIDILLYLLMRHALTLIITDWLVSTRM